MLLPRLGLPDFEGFMGGCRKGGQGKISGTIISAGTGWRVYSGARSLAGSSISDRTISS